MYACQKQRSQAEPICCSLPACRSLREASLICCSLPACGSAQEWEAAIKNGTLKRNALALKAARKAALQAAALASSGELRAKGGWMDKETGL